MYSPLLAVLFVLFGTVPTASAQTPLINHHQVVYTPTNALRMQRLGVNYASYSRNSLPNPSVSRSMVPPPPPARTLQQVNPAPTVFPSTVSSAPSDAISQIEADVFADTNAAREQNGLPDLTWDSSLASLARAHSADMLANNYFSHTDLSGCSADCRLTKSGYSWSSMGENIHMMSGYDLSPAASAEKIVTDWINSPEHRANILNASYTHLGVGIALSGSTVYSTQDFALPR